MMKSKPVLFSISLTFFATLCGAGLLILTTYDWLTPNKIFGNAQRVLFTTISIVMTPLLIWFELPKLKSIEIEDKKIILKNLLTKVKNEITIDKIDGFKTKSKRTKGGHIFETILIVKGKPFHTVSSKYIKNYITLRAELKKRLPVLEVDELENTWSTGKES